MAAAPNNDHNVSKRELVALFKSVSPQYLMDQDEYQVYQSLGDIVTVYRGVALSNKTSVKALSWTLDYKTAEGFAHPFGKEGTVYKAQIQKKHIHAYFAGRNESEVIVDPRYLEQIMQMPKEQFSMKMTQKYVQADELLKQVVCSAYQTHGLWRVSATKDHRVGKAARYWPKFEMRR